MDKALDPRLLGGAIGDLSNLPTTSELREMLAEAEVSAFFLQDHEIPAPLLETAWVFHQVGTVQPGLEIYGAERQVQANAVAAHIFDLALARGFPPGEELVTTFAAQVSSIRGDRTPNSTALARRLPKPQASVIDKPGLASLEAGCSLLSLVRRDTSDLLRRQDGLLHEVATADSPTLEGTPLAAAASVVRGGRALLRYLAYGEAPELAQARDAFERGANDPGSRRDLDSRWVASHLLDLTEDLGKSSVWAILPEDTPPAVGRSMTLGEPPVMALWPPQISLLQNEAHNPLNAQVRRTVITFPTNAGKTLLTHLVVAHHLATVNTPVCVVAPSHSLCREIRQGLDRRLWVLRTDVSEDGPLGDPSLASASVVVMTPERLAARLRTDTAELLESFGLFILDEAHLVGDDSRGWTFETTISRLHELTIGSAHRIVVVSAALGGTATVRTWLNVETAPESSVARWRGPRRLHATYEVQKHGKVTVVPAEGRQRADRRIQDMWGVVTLYVDDGAAITRRGASVGQQVSYGKTTEKPTRAQQLSLVVNLAAMSGSVLTVHATKLGAERLAHALAESRDERPQTPLVRLAEQRLNPTHPLVGVLKKGVAYHHAALPVDIQIEIENAVRSQEIDVVCATTTLTEGVNLPVRTVVVAERGYYMGQEKRFALMIDAPELLNAAGRAGRAGRETEGWVIVAKEPYGPNPRSAVLGLDRDKDVDSTLNTLKALQALDEYETLVALTAGILLENVPTEVDAFLGYCWYLADASAALDPSTRVDSVVRGLRRTLAWQQLSQPIIDRWEALATRLVATYEVTDTERRHRWAQTGTRLSSNLILEQVGTASRAAALDLPWDQTGDPLSVLGVLLAHGGLDALLSLVPERDRRFKRRRYGRTEVIDVDMMSLILDWVSGVDLAGLADRHLSEVAGDDADAFRFEQLSSFLAKVCEHHLPWTTAIILDWIRNDTGVELCPALPAHLHFGAPTSGALAVMRRGVRSRRLAVAIGQRAAERGVPDEELREWLATLGLGGWRAGFNAAPAELGDLLQFVRDPAANISRSLLDGETVNVPCSIEEGEHPEHELAIGYLLTAEPPRPLVAVDGSGDVVAQLHASVHHDLSMLIDAGFQLLGHTQGMDDGPTIGVTLMAE
ncbi:MAG: DEAD/DEAH box helicase [bacterium]|nr:DEAD/DEAH box helicase [bacterium]